MAITLAQLAKLETNPLRKGVIMNIIRDAQLMDEFPFENVGSLKTVAVRNTKLPSVGWRRLNEGFTTSETGDAEQVWESLFGFGGDITYDRILPKLQNMIEDPVIYQTKLKVKALAYDWKDKFINGDHASDEDAIEGLKKRVSVMPSRQTVYFAGAAAAPLDPTASAALARSFFDKLDEAFQYCNVGQVNAIFCNEAVKLGLGRAARYLQTAGNFLDVTKDSLDRSIVTFRGVPLYDMGVKADQTTEIITNTEVAGDSGADSTSVYFASYNMEQGITGIQLSDIEVYDPLGGGEMESTPAKMMRIDWWNGLAGFGSYGIVRARNLAAPSSWT
jgi:hypothetical protein